MSVKSKNKHIYRLFLPLELLDDNPDNPNTMSERTFDLLVENIDQEVGFTDPILVWPKDMAELFVQTMADFKKAGHKIVADAPDEELVKLFKAVGLRFQILGGHHRKDALQYLGEKWVFTTVIGDPEFDQDAAEAQLVRNNVISGKMDPDKFGKLVERQMKKGLDSGTIQAMYGFAEEAEFKKLIAQFASQLPTKELQQKFKDAAEEIKTVDGLSKLLNKMFTTYGDTLPHGYMIVDYGGRHSIWIRASKKTYDAVNLIGEACVENNKVLDDVLGFVIQAIARGDAAELIGEALEKAPMAKLPKGLGMPMADKIEKVASLG